MLLTSASPTENTKLKDPFIKEYSISFFLLEKKNPHTVPGTVFVVKWIPACVNTKYYRHAAGQSLLWRWICQQGWLIGCCSVQGRNMLSYILLECEFPGNVVPDIVSVFFGKYRREYPAHSMCFAMTASQDRREMKNSTFILEWLQSSDRVTKSVRQVVRPQETRNEEQSGRLHQESQEWGHRAKGHMQAE